jgi:trk system potassium uptake protein TrkH
MTRILSKGQKFSRLSDNALLPLVVTAGLLVVGTAAILGANLTSRSGPLGTEIQDALFYSVSARTAGFSLSSLSTMSIGAQLVIVLLMAIGGGPVSTAGGMKTTTVGVLLCTVISSLRGYKWVQFRRREIPSYIVQKAVTVLGLFVAAVLLAFMVLLGVERSAPWPLFFECVSALATVGLSLDLTPQLTTPGKIVIVTLMIVGRIGLATIVYAGVGKIGEQKFRMAQGRFDVG